VRIDKNHLFHGAALLQIAEDPHFKAINPIVVIGGVSRSAYEVYGTQARSAVYLKYATAPTVAYEEYVFNFDEDHLAELKELAALAPKLFLALICVEAHEICCLPYEKLISLIYERKERKGTSERTYTLLVTAYAGRSFRVYMNAPGKKGERLGELVVPRNAFPGDLFKQI
jgi:hypothetical protein